jgi:hypothetical protein
MSVECATCGHENWDHGFRRCNRISGIKPCLCEGFKMKDEAKAPKGLRPCAFCNSADVAAKHTERGVDPGTGGAQDWWYIECGACESRGPLCVRQDLAATGWNMRAEIGELTNTKRVLEERVEQLSKGLRGIATDCASEYPTVARRARRTLEENNEGDVRSPDGDIPSQGQAGTG